jgi:hypothetical protein
VLGGQFESIIHRQSYTYNLRIRLVNYVLISGFIQANTMIFEMDDVLKIAVKKSNINVDSKNVEASGEVVCSKNDSNHDEQGEVFRIAAKDTLSKESVEARSWFESLPSLDRSALVGFSDPIFFEAIRLSLSSRRLSNNHFSAEFSDKEEKAGESFENRCSFTMILCAVDDFG